MTNNRRSTLPLCRGTAIERHRTAIGAGGEWGSHPVSRPKIAERNFWVRSIHRGIPPSWLKSVNIHRFYNYMARQLSNEERQKLRSQLIQGVQRVVAGDPGRTLQGVPVADFLAAAEPNDPFGKFQHRSGRTICNRWARGERPQLTPGRDIYYRNLCTPYLAAELPGASNISPPFTGGQCVGTEYIVLVRIKRPDGVVSQITNSRGRWGPVSRRLDVTGTSYSFKLLFRNASNVPQEITLANYFNATNPPEWDTFTPTPIVGPDNCGNPPDEWFRGVPNPTADPAPGPVGGPPGYGYPGFDITINPDGTISINFGDGNGPVTIDPTADDAPPTAGNPPGDIGQPSAPVDSSAGGDAEGDAPEGEVLVGLKIAILATPPTAKEFIDGVFRAAAYVYMGVPNNLGLYPDAANLQNGQFIFANQDNLTKWKVSANNGYNLRVTPYYREA